MQGAGDDTLSLAKANPALLWLGRPGSREMFLGRLVESPVGRPSSQHLPLPGSPRVLSRAVRDPGPAEAGRVWVLKRPETDNAQGKRHYFIKITSVCS